MNETDYVRGARTNPNAIREDDRIPIDELRTLLQTDPYGIQRIRFDKVINLASLGATSQIALAVPDGAVIQYVGAYIETTVVSSSTTACIGIGSSSAVDKFGFTASLLAGQHVEGLYGANGASAGENIGVVANVSGGGTVGGGNITAGKVHLRVVYDIPVALTS